MKPVSILKMKGTEPTHANLVTIASEWLRKREEMRCSVITTELFVLDAAEGTSGEQADAIGWWGHWSTLVECKASRHDFFDNRNKKWLGMGRYRYFLVPQGLVTPSEIPSGWGLLEWDGAKVHTSIVAPLRDDYDVYHEMDLLITAIRCNKPSTGMRVTYYSSPVNVATMGIEPTN